MKYANDEKAQIEKALWEVVKTASMALMRLNKMSGEEEIIEEEIIEEEKPTKLAKKVEEMPPVQKTLSMADRIASLRNRNLEEKKVMPTRQPEEKRVVQIKKASLTDDKIKSFATRIGNEISSKVKDEEYDLRVLFKQSNTWNEIKDMIDSNSIRSVVSSVNEFIQDKLDQKYAQEVEQAKKKQALLKQKEALLKQAEEQKQLELVEARKQKLANSIKSQKNVIMASIIKEMKPFVKVGNMNTINVALQKSATWQSVKSTLANQTERNAFFSEMIQQSGFLNKQSDFQRDVIPPNRDSFSTGVQTNRGVDNFKGKESVPKGYSDDIGSTAPDSPVNKTLNLDRSDSHGRTPATALNNITEVVQSGGSAKVIPENKGYANNSSPLRQAGEDELENLWSTEEVGEEEDLDEIESEFEQEIEGGMDDEELDDDDFFND